MKWVSELILIYFRPQITIRCHRGRAARAPLKTHRLTLNRKRYRILTFVLSCWLAVSVCCGLSLAVIAGVAYGYNYCLAEFVTLTRSDVRVYMRRGQFYDRPDLLHPRRKSGDEDDIFPYNMSDYHQEVPLGDDSLSEKWMKDEETQKYADKLTKYSEEKTFVDAGQQVDFPVVYKVTTTPSRRASIVLNRIIPTTIMHSGTSEIIMRQFETMPDVMSDINFNDNESYDYRVKELPKLKDSKDDTTSEEKSVEEFDKRVETIPPDIRIRVEDSPKGKTIKMRHWRTTAKPVIMDYSPEVDEEAVVYKAV